MIDERIITVGCTCFVNGIFVLMYGASKKDENVFSAGAGLIVLGGAIFLVQGILHIGKMYL